MAYFTGTERNTGSFLLNRYTNLNIGDLARISNDAMISAGYKLESGQPGNAVYIRGNRALRLLFGAFCKYFKYSITLTQSGPDTVHLALESKSSGMSGGLIGVNQVKNETTRLSAMFATI